MDSITHIVSGALIGEVIAGKELKKKAMLFGAIAQSIPDLDVVTSLWMPQAHSLLAHRGFTHSFTFVVLLAPLLGWLSKKMSRKSQMTFNRWTIFFGAELLVHTLLDSLTSYGTAWLEPFSHQRISFNILFVADPFYTIWLLIPAVILVILKSSSRWRLRWAVFGLLMSTLYIGYNVINKTSIDTVVRKELNRQSISYSEFITTPAPLNGWLWYVIAKTNDGFYTGYHSVFDKTDTTTYFFFARNDSLVASFKSDQDLEWLQRFSQGYYTIENRNDTLVFNDLRFGQILGWDDVSNPFVFHYYLARPSSNRLVVQRGRFAGAGEGAIRSLVKRVKGN